MTCPNSMPLNKNRFVPNVARASNDGVPDGVDDDDDWAPVGVPESFPPLDLEDLLEDLEFDLAPSGSKSSPTSNSCLTLRYRSSKRRE
mmetsp:Transcript_50241/g.76461  ORF Transcript_50241/g.76461 Transcript_50241/m.76461 type:complete len:88 (-) Transcript_50241:390-653(-)